MSEIALSTVISFLQGLNAIIDSGETIGIGEMQNIVEKQILVEHFIDKYKGKCWEWDAIEKFKSDLNKKVSEHSCYFDESTRKYTIGNNGYILLSSIILQLISNRVFK